MKAVVNSAEARFAILDFLLAKRALRDPVIDLKLSYEQLLVALREMLRDGFIVQLDDGELALTGLGGAEVAAGPSLLPILSVPDILARARVQPVDLDVVHLPKDTVG
jgi:hypothetical protein